MEEFLEVVLQRRARQQQLVLDAVPGQDPEKLQRAEQTRGHNETRHMTLFWFFVRQSFSTQLRLLVGHVIKGQPLKHGNFRAAHSMTARPSPVVLRARSGAHLGLVVLEPVRLVHDEHGPVERAERRRVDADELVGRQQHVELHLAPLLHLERFRAASHRALVEGKLMLSVSEGSTVTV